MKSSCIELRESISKSVEYVPPMVVSCQKKRNAILIHKSVDSVALRYVGHACYDHRLVRITSSGIVYMGYEDLVGIHILR